MIDENTSKKRGRPRKERTEAEAPASTEPQRQRIQIHLDPTHPIEGCMLEAYNGRKYYPAGDDFITGIEIVRRALVLGWKQLTDQNPGAYPSRCSAETEPRAQSSALAPLLVTPTERVSASTVATAKPVAAAVVAPSPSSPRSLATNDKDEPFGAPAFT
jgi:hypothetical protein